MREPALVQQDGRRGKIAPNSSFRRMSCVVWNVKRVAARCANSVAANRIAPCAQCCMRTYMTPVRYATSLDVHDACLADPQLTTSVVARVDVLDQAAPTTSFW